MAKAHKSAKDKSIPELAAAVICERVLIDKDDVLSAIRMVDHVTLTVIKAPKKGETIAFGLTMLLSFKAGDTSGGQRKMELFLVNPSGKKVLATQVDLHFASDRPEAGYNVRGDVVVKYDKEGLYWFEVYVDGKYITKMPLRISIVKLEAKPDEVAK